MEILLFLDLPDGFDRPAWSLLRRNPSIALRLLCYRSRYGGNIRHNMDDTISRKFFADMGRKGGQRRAKKLTAEQRRKSAIKASKAAAKARTRKAKEKHRLLG